MDIESLQQKHLSQKRVKPNESTSEPEMSLSNSKLPCHR
jgi:hypothetical protein